jgi:transposase
MKNENFKFFVGIDVSKETLDLALVTSDNFREVEQIQIPNKKQRVQGVQAWLKGFGIPIEQVLFCMEFTGVYNKPLENYLVANGGYLWIEMPVRILRSMGLQRGKNDKVDAQRIAIYAARHESDKIRWVPPTQEQDAIKDLIALRKRLMLSKNMLQVPMKELEAMEEHTRAKLVKSHSQKAIKTIDLEIEKVEEAIRELIKRQPAVAKNISLIKTIPGVGMWTALEMVCTTDNFSRLTKPKQLACHCGCAPFEHTSGTSVKGRTRVNSMANKSLKTLLTMCAISTINSKNDLGSYYQRKVAEGKNKMSVINAVRNKIIHRITAVIERQTPYVPSLQSYS